MNKDQLVKLGSPWKINNVLFIILLEMQFVPSNLFQPVNPNHWQNHQEPQQSTPQSKQPLNQDIASHQAYLQSKNKLIQFISTLGQLRKTDLRPDVLQHVDQLNRHRRVVSSYLSEETILRILNSKIEKMIKNRRLKKNWSEEDIKILIWIVSKYADKNSISDMERDMDSSDWDNIAKLIPGVTGNACLFKWLSLKKVNLASHSWSQQEGIALKNILEQKGWADKDSPNICAINWKIIAEELYKVNNCQNKVFRSAKQCRQHWNCFLNPSLRKGPWRLQQDILLLKLIRSNNGEKKWSEIVYSFQGRTENALKNRYTLLVEKQRKISKSKQEMSLVDDCLERCRTMLNNNQATPATIQKIAAEQSNQICVSKIKLKENQGEQESGGVNQTQSRENTAVVPTQVVSSAVVKKQQRCPVSPVTVLYCSFSDFKQTMLQNRNPPKITPGYLHNGNFKPQY